MSEPSRTAPYPPAIVRWARATHHRGLARPDGDAVVWSGDALNRTCGDRLSLQFHVHADVVVHARFDGEGCALCIAAAAALCESLEGHPPTMIPSVTTALRASLLAATATSDPRFAELQAFAAVAPFPQRHRCVTLAADAADTAVATAQPKDPNA